MNIWLFNPYGPIPGEGWRDYRFTILGRQLAKRGHNVIWWTANYSHHFKKFRSNGWQDVMIESNFFVRLVPTTSYKNNIGIARIIFETVYILRAFVKARVSSPPDLIMGMDPPQLIGYLCIRLARRFGLPCVLDVFDLWPELFVSAFPKIARPISRIILKPLVLVRRYNLRKANAVSTLCDTYLNLIRKETCGLTNNRSITVFNGIDIGAFRSLLKSREADNEILNKHEKREGEIWAIYAGSLGPNYDVSTLLSAADYLRKGSHQISIIICGDGPLKSQVIKFLKSDIRPNLIYLGKLNYNVLIPLYNLCDIGLCAYGAESNVAMPDKLYDYMAAGLPVVNSLPGEIDGLIKWSRIGIKYEAGNPVSLANALISLKNNEEDRLSMAANSYNKAREYDQQLQYTKFAAFIESTADNYIDKQRTLGRS